MPRKTYSVHLEPLKNGKIHMMVPTLPGCEATFNSFETALDRAPGHVADFIRKLAKAGQPIPHEAQRPICLTVEVNVP